MKKGTNIQELFDFVSKKTDTRSIEIFYRSNGIKKELLEFSITFIKALFRKMDESYLGYDYIDNEIDAENHFSWCFRTISTDLKKIEGITVKQPSMLYDYLLDYSLNLFYIPEDENRREIDDSLEYFETALTMNYNKTMMDLELLKQLYTLFHLNLYKKS